MAVRQAEKVSRDDRDVDPSHTESQKIYWVGGIAVRVIPTQSWRL